ncbi:MAG: hypothetical protein WBF66_13065 [Dehalococcoidia bacterium]
MVTTAGFPVRVAGETPFEQTRTISRVVEIPRVEEPSTGAEKLPLELRLKRQREIIHARRGELKRFLSRRETPFMPLRTIPQVVEVGRAAEPATLSEEPPLEVRLKRQREIIHARRGELKRFLSPR